MKKKLSVCNKGGEWTLLYCLPWMDVTLGQDETHASPNLFWQESCPWLSSKPERSFLQ